MKALTIWQPWATLIALGEKCIETRSWSTTYRGPLAIHAGTHWSDFQGYTALWGNHFRDVLARHRVIPSQKYGMVPMDLPLGVVVATCTLVQCEEINQALIDSLSEQETAFGNYTLGRYAWVLEGIQKLHHPIPARGLQRLWNWEPIAEECSRQRSVGGTG